MELCRPSSVLFLRLESLVIRLQGFPLDTIKVAPLFAIYANRTAPYYVCMSNITLDSCGMGALMPDIEWVIPPPT